MDRDLNAPPLNPLPWIVWALALPIIAVEVVVQLGAMGFAGGPDAIGWRLRAMEYFAFAPDFLRRSLMTGDWPLQVIWRQVSYILVQRDITSTLFVVVFLLALGKMVGEIFRWWAVALIFLASAAMGALIYTLVMPTNQIPLIGGFPAAYGLIGAFTFIMWVRHSASGSNQWRAFSMIGVLMGVQIFFGAIYGGVTWVAELGGFVTGFALSFLVAPGGPRQLMQHLRRR
ncbi:rhomboid family intramembrane serine protease [Xinfangfangia sp. CPCC 101601]|uniref:Rhomboid family intramembrane serine protease n=1 Tax=Pseudogemmobacter lacusdianii TaxID=3069608 RepID=A0ABU0W023_9RHOB|nr:rhomboid family intramembrane serine protease [Xinfangfangia sp. CPCC 101601]MDQ2067361.1 rhomboid family intramembrane serine protease [Xinfangfangia sp. CPCC 101601]